MSIDIFARGFRKGDHIFEFCTSRTHSGNINVFYTPFAPLELGILQKPL